MLDGAAPTGADRDAPQHSPASSMNPPPSLPPAKAQEWDEIRTAFASSLLVDTALSSLAQNLDGLDWPLPGPAETPAAYIEFTHEELVTELTARGNPAAADLLMEILRETLAFDQPFGEMVKQTEAAAERDNPLLRGLARLGIPESFPLELTTLDETARQLCRLENVSTIGEFALFAQRLAQGVIVGGDLRKMLNALAHGDESALAELLPFRPGASGLHLAEALVHATRSATPAESVGRALVWFGDECAEWRRQAAADRKFLRRQFARFDDSALEAKLHELLAPHFAIAKARRPFWSAVLSRFRP